MANTVSIQEAIGRFADPELRVQIALHNENYTCWPEHTMIRMREYAVTARVRRAEYIRRTGNA